MLKLITEKTGISLTLVLTLVGGVLWLSHMFFLTESTAKAVEKVTVKQETDSATVIKDIAEIKSDIRVIKQILKKGN